MVLGFRHAIGAAEIAAIQDGNPEIANRPPHLVPWAHLCG
jgi:hypothetical protein